MSGAEWDRVVDVIGIEPRPTPDQERRLRCPMLDEARGLCSIYEQRPLICRLFGLVEGMRCPYGCIPDRWLTDAEAYELMTEADNVGRTSRQPTTLDERIFTRSE